MGVPGVVECVSNNITYRVNFVYIMNIIALLVQFVVTFLYTGRCFSLITRVPGCGEACGKCYSVFVCERIKYITAYTEAYTFIVIRI